MKTRGNLQAFPLPDLIQMLSALGRCAVVSLQRDGETGLLVLRQNAIVYADAGTSRTTLGALLLFRSLVTESELQDAQHRRAGSGGSSRLAELLVDMGVLTRGKIEQAIDEHVRKSTQRLLEWDQGGFEFAVLDSLEEHGLDPDVIDLVLSPGIPSEILLMRRFSSSEEPSSEPVTSEPAGVEEATPEPTVAPEAEAPRSEDSEFIHPEAAPKAKRSTSGGVDELMSSLGLQSPKSSATPSSSEPFEYPAETPLSTDSQEWEELPRPGAPAASAASEVPQPESAQPEAPQAEPQLESPQSESRQPEVPQPEPRTEAGGLSLDDFKAFISSDPHPTLIVDGDGQILFANRSMASSVLSTVVELQGSPVTALVHFDDQSTLRELLRDVGDGADAATVRLGGADGTWKDFYPLPGVARDQTGKKSIMLRASAGGDIQQRHDPLTGLLNREAMVERIGRNLQRAQQEEGATFAVLVIDVDRFKLVNTGFGWATANELLRAVGGRLVEHLRPGDVVGRLAGDQFCVLLDRLRAPEDAALVSGRIIEVLDRPFMLEGQEICISVSIGASTSHPEYQDAEEMVGEAELAMTTAKTERGASIHVGEARPAGRTRAEARFQLEADIRRGIEHDEFTPYFQPILSLDDGSPRVLEVLVRWQHPQKGLLEPAAFLAAAEDTGLIIPIAKKLLRDACVQLRRWDRFELDPPLALGMNFTANHLERSEVLNTLKSSMSRSGVEGRQLVVEVTERMVMHHPDHVLQMLGVLKELGVQVFLDDFGVEYSSLSYLHELPVDAIKLDRSFVSKIGTDTGSEIIVRAIIDLAHKLGKKVVGEGIETSEQLDLMRELGSDFGQGFLFARPASAEGIDRILSSDLPWANLFATTGEDPVA